MRSRSFRRKFLMNDDSRTRLTSECKRLSLRFAALITLCVFCLVGQGYSQDEPGKAPTSTSTTSESDQKLLKAVQNPLADLISVPILSTTNFNIKPQNRIQNVISLEPAIPLNLSDNWLLVTRVIQPIVSATLPGRNTWRPVWHRRHKPQRFTCPRGSPVR